MKILLVDDDALQHQLIKKLCKQINIAIELVCFFDAQNFFFNLDEHLDAAAIFLDVELIGDDGLVIARKLRQRKIDTPLVFMTAHPQYALESYDVFALDYLLKPVTKLALERTFERLNGVLNTKPEVLLIEVNASALRLNQDDIYSIEAMGHECIISLKETIIEVKEPLGKVMERLSNQFIMTHRSYSVNLKHVYQVRKESILLDNQIVIPLSRRLLKDVQTAFVKFNQHQDFTL